MITRRGFLKSAALSVFSVSIGGIPAFLNRSALASTEPQMYKRRKTLVAIFQRGAMDGLMAVSPVGDPNLSKMRPRLSMSAAKSGELIDLDNGYALHPSFSPFYEYFKEGRLAIVHGVGSPNSTRSHFDAQDYMETGTPFRKGTDSGWLNRAAGLTGHDPTPFQSLALTPALPKSLYGPNSSIAVSDLNNFRIREPGTLNANKNVTNGFESLYEQTADELLREKGRDSFEATRIIEKLNPGTYRPANGARYPNSTLGTSLKQIAMLVKAGIGLEIAFAESGGWDTHVRQGTSQGQFSGRASDLAQSVDAFWKDLGKYRDDVAVMTMTEFGRTVKENGSRGTDHGRGSCMFVLGNNVEGGALYGSVPTLVPELLEDGRDLPVSIDFRSLFSDVAGHQLGISRDELLFPGWNGSRLNVMKG